MVLPVRDGALFVEAAIRSILAQSFDDFELLVVDDGSVDASARIVDQIRREDGRIRLVQQAPLGQPAALNRGLELARADLIARMDADDLAFPERFALQVGWLGQHRDVGLVGGATLQMSSAGRPLRVASYPVQDGAIRRALDHGHATFCHPSIMLRTELVRRLGGYRSGFQPAEDRDLYLRTAERSALANLPQVILAYRLHPSQLSVRHIEQQVLGGWAANCDARARAAGVTEPFAGRPVTLQRLHEMGCNASDITNEVVGVIATRAALFASIGELDASRRLIRQARARARWMQLDAPARARVLAASACVLLGEGQRRRALAALAGAAVANPRWLADGVLRRLQLTRRLAAVSPPTLASRPALAARTGSPAARSS